MLILAIAKYLNKLFQDGSLAAVTTLSKASGVVVVAIDHALVLIVAILSAEGGRADGAGEMVNVVFAIEGSNIGATKRTSTVRAEEVEASKVIRLTERVLHTRAILFLNGEELGGHNVTAILQGSVAEHN